MPLPTDWYDLISFIVGSFLVLTVAGIIGTTVCAIVIDLITAAVIRRLEQLDRLR
jgi:hypothetical protein